MRYYFGQKKLEFNNFNYRLSGFSKREASAETIGISKLFVKLLWLKIHTKDILFISIDILYIPDALSQSIYNYLRKKYNIKTNNILFNATHTHSAPGIEKKFDAFVNKRIIKYIFYKIVEVVNESNFKSGKLSFNTFKSQSNMWISRRKIGKNIRKLFLKKSMLMLPNEKNEIDDRIRLISIVDQNNTIDLIVYNFSCHPVFNISKDVSSDFIGQISRDIERELGTNTMFLQGFLGDIRPNFTTDDISKVGIFDKLKIIVNKKIFKTYDINDFNKFCIAISNEIGKNIKIKNKDYIEVFNYKNYKYEIFSKSNKSTITFTIKVFLIDNNIFVSIPAEVNSKYYVKLSNKFNNFNIIPMGLADNIIGYLPFYDEIKEGGYEVTSIVHYGIDSPFSEVSLRNFYFSLQRDIESVIWDNQYEH